MDTVHISYLGTQSYKEVWNLQERLLQRNVTIKQAGGKNTQHYLLLCQHFPVYTIGKNGNMSNLLMREKELKNKGIEFYIINRGGDVTFHGPGQLIAYPILDLERIETDIGRYVRTLETTIINILKKNFRITGTRSKKETGVWVQDSQTGEQRKICAIGIRLSRWISMHGLAFNINTDLSYFSNIVPCGIKNKGVTSLSRELNNTIAVESVLSLFEREFTNKFHLKAVDIGQFLYL